MIIFAIALCVAAFVLLLVVVIINRNIRVEESDRERAARMSRELSGASDKTLEKSSTSHLARRISSLATEAGIRATARQVLLGFLGVAFVAFVVGWSLGGSLLGCVCAVCAPLIGVLVLRSRATSRLRAFDRQFAASLRMIAESMMAGKTAEYAFETASKYAPDPLKAELSRLVAEVKYGRLPLEQAIARMASRTGSTDAAFLETAVSVQKVGGGKLSDVLKSTAYKIEARLRLRGMIDSTTSQARWVAKMMAVVPFAGLAIFVLAVPEIGSTFWASPLWPFVIIVMVALDALALWSVQRLYKMKVE